MKWIQGGISAVTGIAEPEYGSDYIHSVTDRVKGKQPFRETTREDMEWLAPDHTNVETVTFYYSDLKTGIVGFAQIIHSNIIGIHKQAQFTFRIFNSRDPTKLNLWTSTKLEDFRIEGTNFYAKDLLLELNEDNDQYHFKSTVNPKSTVDLYIKRLTPGCKVGDDPSTYYGDNLEEPWGRMRHVFWPRNSIHGTINIKIPVEAETEGQEKPEPKEQQAGKDIDAESSEGKGAQEDENAEDLEEDESAEDGEQSEETESSDEEEILEDKEIVFAEEDPAFSMFSMAFQGMKPHHAAKSWNFMYFHSKEHTAVLMEFTTPKSYANTKVSIGVLTSKSDIISVTVDNDCQHLDSEIDSVGWNVPNGLSINYKGFTTEVTDEELETQEDVEIEDSKKIVASVNGKLTNLVERIDVMNEIPSFIKTIVSGVAGTKPYIYQYANDGFELKINDKPVEKGFAWIEVTFISESEDVTDESYDEA